MRPFHPVGAASLLPYNPPLMLPLDTLINADSIKTLNDAPSAWADLCFADPPFNIGYRYHGYDDSLKLDDYLQFSEDWIAAVHRALKPTGSFFLAIGDEYVADLAVIARRKVGFNMRNWIVWHYTFGQHARHKFSRSHTHILYLTKDPEVFTFNADAVRVASARQTTYADLRANPKGKVPDDTWYLRPQEIAPGAYFEPGCDTWNISRICGTFKEREGWHGCQMPIAVLNRIVRVASNPGDVVLDPFNGSGTTSVAAALLGRRYVGIDQSPEYVEYARKRLKHIEENKDNNLFGAPAMAPDDADITPALLLDATRESKVETELTAFGRPRVPRRRAKKSKGL